MFTKLAYGGVSIMSVVVGQSSLSLGTNACSLNERLEGTAFLMRRRVFLDQSPQDPSLRRKTSYGLEGIDVSPDRYGEPIVDWVLRRGKGRQAVQRWRRHIPSGHRWARRQNVRHPAVPRIEPANNTLDKRKYKMVHYQVLSGPHSHKVDSYRVDIKSTRYRV
jgi:hypothetical protein